MRVARLHDWCGIVRNGSANALQSDRTPLCSHVEEIFLCTDVSDRMNGDTSLYTMS